MKGIKRFLARPIKVPVSVFAIMVILTAVVLILSAAHLRSPAPGANDAPWFVSLSLLVIALLAGLLTFARSIAWMREEYPNEVHKHAMAQRMAIRRGKSRFQKWVGALGHLILPLVGVAFFGFFTIVLAAGVGLFATGVIP